MEQAPLGLAQRQQQRQQQQQQVAMAVSQRAPERAVAVQGWVLLLPWHLLPVGRCQLQRQQQQVVVPWVHL
jgi:hypothetical protein